MSNAPRRDLLSSGIAITLSPEVYGEVYKRMVDQSTISKDIYSRSGLLSFTDQMAHITNEGSPDCFLFTANSAVPVSDAVRGYFDELGQPCPKLGYIDAKSTLVHERHGIQLKHRDQEVQRLKPLLEGLGSVAIVEQFVSSGNTLRLAAWIVRSSGVKKVRPLGSSNWYHDARTSDIDLEQVTSTHAEFMFRVGAHAARRVRNGDYNKRPHLLFTGKSLISQKVHILRTD